LSTDTTPEVDSVSGFVSTQPIVGGARVLNGDVIGQLGIPPLTIERAVAKNKPSSSVAKEHIEVRRVFRCSPAKR
jgi:hypothetical protein